MTPEQSLAMTRATSWRPIEPGECPLCGLRHTYVMTLKEFCERYRLSRSAYYDLADKPQELRVGGRVMVTSEAAREWEKRCTR